MGIAKKTGTGLWISRVANISLFTGLVVLVTYFVYTQFATSSDDPEFSGPRTGSNNREQIYERADEAFDREDWIVAAANYEKVTRFDPDNMRAWVRYAYSLHQNKDLDRAIAAHMKVCEFPRARSWGLYNLACAYAIKNEKQMALDYLFEAVEAGFLSRRSIVKDEDFANLVDDPRFLELAERATPISSRPPNRQMDFLLGEWELRDLLGGPIGTYEVTASENGHLLTFNYQITDELHGTTVCFYDPSDERWRYVEVDRNGQTSRCAGQLFNGVMKYEGFLVRADGSRVQRRVEFTPERDGTIGYVTLIAEERSSTWRRDLEGYFRRPAVTRDAQDGS